jgi:hypothetical protein
MSIYHYAVLGIILLPLLAWVWNNSRTKKLQSPSEARPDLGAGPLSLRLFALLLGYGAVYGLSGGSPAYVVGQAIVPIAATAVLFLAAWLVPKLVGRSLSQPRKRLFELSLFVFCLVAIASFIVTKTEEIRRSSGLASEQRAG